MKHLTYFLATITFCICSIVACDTEQENEETITTVKRPVYLCCNPWDEIANQETNGKIKDIVQEFLETNQVTPLQIDSIQEGEQVECFVCCECPAGFAVYVDIEESDKEKALDLGFQE